MHKGTDLLNRLKPLQSTEVSPEGIIVPHLRTIVLESGMNYHSKELERLRAHIEGWLSTFAEERRRAGADPLHTMTLRRLSFSENKEGSQDFFTLDCGNY